MPASKGGKLKVDPAGCGGSSVHVRVDEVRSCGACNVVLAKEEPMNALYVRV
jgi:hypothetical protein